MIEDEIRGKLLVTVAVYHGTMEEAAQAVSSFTGTFVTSGGGEVEILAVEAADE